MESQVSIFFQELTGSQFSTDNKVCKSFDDSFKPILKAENESIIWGLRVYRHNDKSFHNFLPESKINELQAAAVNDKQHTPETNVKHGDVIVTNIV